MTSFDSSAERLYKKMLQGSFAVYLALAAWVTLIHLPAHLNEDVRDLPERVAKLMLEAPQPLQTPIQVPAEKSSSINSKKPKKEKSEVSKPSPRQVQEMVQKTGLLAALIQEEKTGGLDSLVQDRRMTQVLSDSRLITAPSSQSPRQTFKESGHAAPGLSDQKLKEMAGTARGERVQLAKKEDTLVSGASGRGGAGTGGDSIHSLGQGSAVRVKGSGSANIDYDAIARVVEQYKGGLIYLYNKELRKIPTLKGTIAVEFSIDAGGKVVEARVVSSTMEYSPLEEALTDRIRHWKFPHLYDGIVVVTYPFVFFPV
ncbi:MAG: TonB family protein [Nitrospirae bacterium]|nr:TonB family protein [Nitrospirota bacterium]